MATTRRSRMVAALAAAAMLAGLGVAQSLPAQAQQQPVQTQPLAYGRVTHVDDGDTIDVDVTGDGTRKIARIRFIGVQAMELTHYSNTLSKIRGECWAPAATRYLYQLTFHRQVRLLSQKGITTYDRGGTRLHRNVEVLREGTWQDVQGLMLDAGLVLAEANQKEWLHNRDYRARAQQAAAAGLGIWGDPAHCGAGPSQDQPLSVSIRYDGDGNDKVNLNTEWVDIVNGGTQPVSLAGWWLRDSSNLGYKAHGYPFPPSASVAPGSRLRVHIGRGPDDATNLHMGRVYPLFVNPLGGPKWLGDGAFLFDHDGDLRAHQTYPCEVACAGS
jgi:endonuclease YncB( thermonuclease family)